MIAVTFFVGVSWLAVQTGARPSTSMSVVSQIARATFPGGTAFGFMFWVVQVTTFAILVLAANTSFQGFPRLAALLARDRFFPRQFANLGDRLVFSNGIVVLSGLAIFLLWYYHASVDSLIHLYVLGVFTAFTLSQIGMVRYWRRTRGPRWRRSAAINLLGALATGVVLVVVVSTKFTEGAWLVTIAIPVLVLMFLGINRHYRRTSRRLRAGAAAVTASAPPRSRTSDRRRCDRRLDGAGALVRAGDRRLRLPRRSRSRALDRGGDPGALAAVGRRDRPPLELLPSSEGRVESLLEFVWSVPRSEADFVNVVVPGAVPQALVLRGGAQAHLAPAQAAPAQGAGRRDHGRPARRGRAAGRRARGRQGARLRRPRCVASCDRLRRDAPARRRPRRLLRVRRRRGAQDAPGLGAFGVRLPLDIVEAPFRDLGDPLRTYLRQITATDTVAVVVMPELVVHGWHRLLHNQRALYLKRLLLFEPNVILSSVPYRLG